mgnify:CR=1 FL=1
MMQPGHMSPVQDISSDPPFWHLYHALLGRDVLRAGIIRGKWRGVLLICWFKDSLG